jgi:hypothetical protein
MVGGIIPEWWAASSRNGGRHHPGMAGGIISDSVGGIIPDSVGGLLRNQHANGRSNQRMV